MGLEESSHYFHYVSKAFIGRQSISLHGLLRWEDWEGKWSLKKQTVVDLDGNLSEDGLGCDSLVERLDSEEKISLFNFFSEELCYRE